MNKFEKIWKLSSDNSNDFWRTCGEHVEEILKKIIEILRHENSLTEILGEMKKPQTEVQIEINLKKFFF